MGDTVKRPRERPVAARIDASAAVRWKTPVTKVCPWSRAPRARAPTHANPSVRQKVAAPPYQVESSLAREISPAARTYQDLFTAGAVAAGASERAGNAAWVRGTRTSA